MRIAGTQNNAFSEMDFDWVIIDESARCDPLELLVPVVRGKKIVLLGDHKQLPPHRDEELEKDLEKNEVITPERYQKSIEQSLFNRLYVSAPQTLRAFLDVQFRMNPEISRFIKGFYDDKLDDGEGTDAKDHGLRDLWPGSIFWVSTSAIDKKTETKKSMSHHSFGNRAEVDVIRRILEDLDSAYLRLSPDIRKTVGVITGYAYQRDLLAEECISRGPELWKCLDVEINTIDAFQGREKNIVILSLVRSNHTGRMGFIPVDTRVNVALSRAQELLIIVGDDEFLGRHQQKAGRLGIVLEELKKMGRMRNGLGLLG
jgi:superfamily I DNA and/or RNA helicase